MADEQAQAKSIAGALPTSNGDDAQTNAADALGSFALDQPKLSNAERKKQAKTEKAARRAQEKAAGATGRGEATGDPVAESSHDGANKQAVPAASSAIHGPSRKGSISSGKSGADQTKPQPQQHRRTGSAGAQAENTLALPSKPSQTPISESKAEKKTQVPFVSHLYSQTHRQSIEGTSKDVHKEVLALGLNLSNYIICGSHARGVSTLLALRSFVSDYTTPHGTSLPRHLSNHALSPQLTHIRSSRPFSTTQSNSIRWLKNLIAKIDPSTPELTAKQHIMSQIDSYISERFAVAKTFIADAASKDIVNGDIVLTYGHSAVVLQTLLSAAMQARKRFRVIVVDSRPLLEGRKTVHALAAVGVQVEYFLIAGLGNAVRMASKCILGAHAVLGNGAIYARAGTAMMASTLAGEHSGAPVIVCAEAVKLTDRVALDSLVANELAPEDELIDDILNCASSSANDVHGTDETNLEEGLKAWRDKDNFFLLNPMYDVTPAQYISRIITEAGIVTPKNAARVHQLYNGT